MIPTNLSVPTSSGRGLSFMLLAGFMVLGLSLITMLISKAYRRWF